MKGFIVLNQKEAHRGHVLEQIAQKALTLKEAAVIMGVSYRQAKRIQKKWRSNGLSGLPHGNRGRSVGHAISPELAADILSLHEAQYAGFNDTHFVEMLVERENIFVSREKVRQLLRSAGRPPKRKRRAKKHHARRARKETAGVMMQWDGSPHRWFGPEQPPCCLMSAIDDATTTLLGALFVPVESSLSYLRLLDTVVRRYGAPLSVYQDRHGALVRTDNHWSVEEQLQGKQYPTHVGRVLEDFGIQAISAHSPQAKGRVERGFGVMQDRLIAELGLHGITDMETANEWLESYYIPRHNKRFSKRAAKAGKAFVKVYQRERYEKISFAYEAVVSNDNCVRLGGLLIDVPRGKNGCGYAKAKVLVKQHLDGCWTVRWKDQVIAKHPATPVIEPVRSWKKRAKVGPVKGRSLMQVYISSQPAPLP